MTKLYILFASLEVLASAEFLYAIYLARLEFSGSLALGDLLSVMNMGNFFHRPFSVHRCGFLDLARYCTHPSNQRQCQVELAGVLAMV